MARKLRARKLSRRTVAIRKLILEKPMGSVDSILSELARKKFKGTTRTTVINARYEFKLWLRKQDKTLPKLSAAAKDGKKKLSRNFI